MDAAVTPDKPARGTKRAHKEDKPMKVTKSKKPRKNKTGRRPIVISVDLFSGSSIFEDAAAGEDLVSSADWAQGTSRDDVFESIFADIPPEELEQARRDEKLFNKQANVLRAGSVQPANNGKWSVAGMRTPLFSHQVQGAGFMRGREKGRKQPRGGIIADQMGLGKTNIILAAIADGRPGPTARRRTTLIVSTPNNFEQMTKEIEKHCVDLDPKQYSTDIPGIGRLIEWRNKSPWRTKKPTQEILECDLVLTTYSEVVKSYKRKEQNYLHQVHFHRICLDEVHEIRNRETVKSRACRALKGTHRWAITGTPLVNSVNDLFCYLNFIGHPIADDWKTFKAAAADAVAFLEGQISPCMLRRTYKSKLFGSCLVDLPKTTHCLLHIELDGLEAKMYLFVQAKLIAFILQLDSVGGCRAMRALAMCLLTRARQLVSHPLMLHAILGELFTIEDAETWLNPANYEDERDRSLAKIIVNAILQAHGKGTKRESPQMKKETMSTGEAEQQGPTDQQDCCYCDQPAQEPQLTSCRHVYCLSCVVRLSQCCAQAGLPSPQCTSCTSAIEAYEDYIDSSDFSNVLQSSKPGAAQVIRLWEKDKTASEGDIEDWLDDGGRVWRSAKVLEAVKQIKAILEEDPTAKIILFIQWLGFSKVLARVCMEEGWGHLEFNGQITAERKDKVIEAFVEPENKILIASLKAGGVGLNLKMASRIILLDHWWNAAIENQAFARVYRIGQEKETQMMSIITKNTVEERMMEVKKSKDDDIAGLIPDERSAPKLGLEEIKGLFVGRGGQDGCNDGNDTDGMKEARKY